MNRREHLLALGAYTSSLTLCRTAHAKFTSPSALSVQASSLQWVTPEVRGRGLSFHTFPSKAVGTEVSFHIYVPSAYTNVEARRFPVVYWLHGSGGGLNGIARLSNRADRAILAGKVPAHLIVFVNGLSLGMYVDWANGKAPLETIIIRELLPHIDTNWRTIATRDGRLLDGFSMGGYGAARLGFRYPKLFRHVSIMGAGPMQESLDSTPRASGKNAADLLNEVYGGDQAHFKRLSPHHYAEQNSAVLSQSSHLRLVIGDQDETFENNDRFHAQLVRLGIPHDWIILPGIGRNPMHVLRALGDQHWHFYRKAFDLVAA